MPTMFKDGSVCVSLEMAYGRPQVRITTVGDRIPGQCPPAIHLQFDLEILEEMIVCLQSANDAWKGLKQ